MTTQSSFLDPNGSVVVTPVPTATSSPSAPDPLIELIARISGESVARRVGEASSSDWIGGLASMDPTQLASEYGISPVAATRIAAAVELHHRMLRAQHPRRASIQTPEAVGELMAGEALLDHERFWCLALNARSQLLGTPIVVSVGDVDGTEAGPRSFLRAALRSGAVAAIAVHNHPSGLTDPSPADVAVTRRLIAAGKAVDLPIHDHCIIAAGVPTHSLRRSHASLWA